MSNPTNRVAALLAVGALMVLAACTQSQLAALVVAPAGPVSVHVNESTDFSASPAPDGVSWSVEGIAGGNAEVGTIAADGTYTAPDRVPAGGTVQVTATDSVRPERTASATVEVTAPGTMYVLDGMVYVYGALDTVDGDVAPDRSFRIDGLTGGDAHFDMDVAPASDHGFLTAQTEAPMIFRVPSISTAEGTIADYATFDANGWSDPSGVVYDATRDILYVCLDGGLLAFGDATTAPDGSTADRIVTGANVGIFASDPDVRLTLDESADRLFLSHPEGSVAVYDDASGLDGNVAPDRTFMVDVPTLEYLWGAAYDSGRDELYLGDQKSGEAVYVIDDASTATGPVTPSRTLGGASNPLSRPSMVTYDAVHDRLAVVTTADPQGVAVFDDASTRDGDVAPDRFVTGPSVPLSYAYGGHLDPTQ
jgi:hypothetical protein